MFPRFAPVTAALIALAVAAACGTATAPVDPASPVPATPATSDAPQLTPVPRPDVAPTPSPSRNAGDVDGWPDGPELTVEFPREDLVEVTLEDATAKAWRIVVTGTGDLAQDRLEIVVEAAELMPAITATEIQDGSVVDVMDLGGFLDDTAVAGGCHARLNVCIDSSWFRLPADDDGRLTVRLQMPAPGAAILVTGGTAGWPDEPFVLGPWADTEPFPWGER